MAFTLLGVVLAATAISIYTPRLTLSITAAGPPLYSVDFGKTYARQDVLNLLDKVLQSTLENQGDRIFNPGKIPKKTLEYDSKTPLEQQIAELNVLLPLARLPITLKAGNVGLLASTISGMSTVIVEEVDGQRTLVYLRHEPVSIEIGQGKTVEIKDTHLEMEEALSTNVGKLFINYEIIHALRAKTNSMKLANVSNDKYFTNLVDFYSVFLPFGQDYARLASKSHTSKIVLIVAIFDIYGRSARAETVIFDSQLPQNQ